MNTEDRLASLASASLDSEAGFFFRFSRLPRGFSLVVLDAFVPPPDFVSFVELGLDLEDAFVPFLAGVFSAPFFVSEGVPPLFVGEGLFKPLPLLGVRPLFVGDGPLSPLVVDDGRLEPLYVGDGLFKPTDGLLRPEGLRGRVACV